MNVKRQVIVLTGIIYLSSVGHAFLAPSVTTKQQSSRMTPPTPSTSSSSSSSSSSLSFLRQSVPSATRLQLLLDVPDGFFTITFPMLGILLSLSKNFARIRMEENAWEQRLAEGRRRALRADPTLTELDLRRQEAAAEWSAYGKPRMEQEEREREFMTRRGGARTKVMERENDDKPSSPSPSPSTSSRNSRMTDEDIAAFEMEYGVTYDPYYDEPYTKDELPTDVAFTTDRRYGDRIYENGEIFYKHGEDMYYRQGAKPRNLKFWD